MNKITHWINRWQRRLPELWRNRHWLFWGWLLEYEFFGGLGGQPNGHAISPRFTDGDALVSISFSAGNIWVWDENARKYLSFYGERVFRKLALFALFSYPIRRWLSISPVFRGNDSDVRLSYLYTNDFWYIVENFGGPHGLRDTVKEYYPKVWCSSRLMMKLFLWYLWRWAWGDWFSLRSRWYFARVRKNLAAFEAARKEGRT